MTDVNIATHLLVDAFQNKYDKAILISGDSDLVPPIQMIKKLQLDKKIIVAFPPNRISNQLKKVSDGYFNLGKKYLNSNQFEDCVQSINGFNIYKPEEWK